MRSRSATPSEWEGDGIAVDGDERLSGLSAQLDLSPIAAGPTGRNGRGRTLGSREAKPDSCAGDTGTLWADQ